MKRIAVVVVSLVVVSVAVAKGVGKQPVEASAQAAQRHVLGSEKSAIFTKGTIRTRKSGHKTVLFSNTTMHIRSNGVVHITPDGGVYFDD